MDAWYVARLQPGLARTAAEHLKRQGWKSYQPVGKDWRSGKRTGLALRPVALFPGYIFIQFDIEEDRWRSINGTRGVVGLVGTLGRDEIRWPGKLPKGFVEELMGLEERGELDAKEAEAAVYRYKKEDPVRVESGPFTGFTGEFVRYHKGALILLVGLFGRKNELRLRPDQTSPASVLSDKAGRGSVGGNPNKKQERVAA